MKLIPTRQAVGQVLCHDLTQIVPGSFKGPRFRRGHIVTEEDIPVLLAMGKEHLYVWESTPGMLHEDEAASRLAALCRNAHMSLTPPREGRINLLADCDGLFQVRSQALRAVNRVDQILIATRQGDRPVHRGDMLAGTRVVPLVIPESLVAQAEAAAGGEPLLALRPYVRRTAALVATGSEVRSGLIPDAFTPVVREKLAAYGIETTLVLLPGDGVEPVAAAIRQARSSGADMVLCTGGMSVDPDDSTPGAIRTTGARIVTYGVPVLPGAMFLLGYWEDGTPVLGLPGCVMSAPATIFDLVLPRVAADVEIRREDLTDLGEGGLCLGCQTCRWPLCPFGS